MIFSNYEIVDELLNLLNFILKKITVFCIIDISESTKYS